MHITDRLVQKGERLAKVQVRSKIKASEEEIVRLIERLHEDPELMPLASDVSKVPSFALRGDPGSIIQVSPKGKVILTAASASSFGRLRLRLIKAIIGIGLPLWCLEQFEAEIHRIERYEVKSIKDVDGLILAQTILGTRGRKDMRSFAGEAPSPGTEC